MRHIRAITASVRLSRGRFAFRRNPLGAAVAVAILNIVGATSTHATVIYQDNFQSATNGQTILASPVNWVGIPDIGFGTGAFPLVNTTAFAPALATTRTGNGTGSNGGIAQFPISGISTDPGSGNIVLTARIYVPTVSNIGSFVGLNRSSSGPFNNAGAYVGVGGSIPAYNFDLRGLDGSTVLGFTAAESAPLLDKIVTATLELNVNTNTFTGTITDGINTLTQTKTGGLNLSGFDNVAINYTSNDAVTPMNVGSLLVAQVPEPSSVLLLGAGGVIGGILLLRRRTA